MLEKDLERQVVEYVKKLGGKAYKWVSPGETGVPDRIVLLPGARIIFVELKRPGRKDGMSPRQKKVFRILRGLGFTCWRIDDFNDFVKRVNNEI